jgi:hypothetical protein
MWIVLLTTGLIWISAGIYYFPKPNAKGRGASDPKTANGCAIPAALAGFGFFAGLVAAPYVLPDMDVHPAVMMYDPHKRAVCLALLCGYWLAVLAALAAPIIRAIPSSKPVTGVDREGLPAWVATVIPAALLSVFLIHVAETGTRGGMVPTRCVNNLKWIGLALQMYQEAHGSFPPAYVADKSGRPMHSWRVLILPFLESAEAKELYAAYSFAEPWDGPNNRKLAGTTPYAFACTVDPGRRRMTSYLAVTGEGTAFPDGHGVKPEDSVVTLVEVRESGVAWTEPRDLPLARLLSSPPVDLGRDHGGRVTMALADGTVERVKGPDLRRLLTVGKGRLERIR